MVIAYVRGAKTLLCQFYGAKNMNDEDKFTHATRPCCRIVSLEYRMSMLPHGLR